MPILRPFSKLYPKMFPAGYSGSQVLRFALKDGPEQRVYQSADYGLAGYKNLQSDIFGAKINIGSLYGSISGHNPSNLSSAISAVRCQTLSPKKYLVGYESGVPQFIETRQQFRCVSFISGYLKTFVRSPDDLPATIRGWVSSYGDLGADLTGLYTMFQADRCLPAVIKPYATLPGSLPASVVGSYCQTLSPERYVVGYENGIPRFLEGRQRFRCVDFISGYIKRTFPVDLNASISSREIANVDLPAYLNVAWLKGTIDLGLSLRGWARGVYQDLPANLHGWEESDLQAIIGMHLPVDLLTCLNVFSQDIKNLPANIHGWQIKDLLATLRGVVTEDLPAYLFSVPPKDLPAYLKVWPQEDLPANLHGWGSKDLNATISWNVKRDLPAVIGAHPWKNLGIILRGWAREAIADLPAYLRAFLYEDMSAVIRATYFEDLPAYLYGIPSKNLPAHLHGWDTKDLPAILVGGYGPNDIQAYINAYNRPVDLPVSIIGRIGIEIPRNLVGVVSSWCSKDLGLHMNPIPSINLNAYLVSSGDSSNLHAYIYPKMINLTTIVSVTTMEHLDLAAVINLCGASGHSNLRSYIRCMYLKDLGASIEGKVYPNYVANLGAKIGYADSYFNIDRLPLTVSVASGYTIEDKLPLYINIFVQQADLTSYITGTPMYSSLGASLTATWLREHEFENYKHKEMVYDLDRTGRINWNEVVELVFDTIVDDYFYIEAAQRVHKMDKYARWVLEMSSYVPENTDTGVRRKLHRMKKLYDLTRFNNIDEAMRFAINYVTEYNYGNLSALIAITGGFSNLSSYIKPDYFTTTNSDLSSSITVQEKTFILGFDDKIEFH